MLREVLSWIQRDFSGFESIEEVVVGQFEMVGSDEELGLAVGIPLECAGVCLSRLVVASEGNKGGEGAVQVRSCRRMACTLVENCRSCWRAFVVAVAFSKKGTSNLLGEAQGGSRRGSSRWIGPQRGGR